MKANPEKNENQRRNNLLFKKRLHGLAKSLAANFFGIADLSAAKKAIFEQGGPVVSEFPRAISVGITLFHSIVNQLPQRFDRLAAMNYRYHCYEFVNQRLDYIASMISSMLQIEGFNVLPVPASKVVDDNRLCGHFSHKMAAHLAGLGWIGKSCLLVTPEAGPRVRWVTVLTDADLEATGSPLEDRCGNCRQCIDICPQKAFTGRPFNKEEPREFRYEAQRCHRYLSEIENSYGFKVCGLCLYICPYGKKKTRKI